MPDRCCIPNCSSNSDGTPYVRAFHFPQNEELYQKWVKIIPRKDWQPTSNSVVCIKHFQESDLSYYIEYVDNNNKPQKFPRDRPKLRENAIPR